MFKMEYNKERIDFFVYTLCIYMNDRTNQKQRLKSFDWLHFLCLF